jgi:hypothetical protein
MAQGDGKAIAAILARGHFSINDLNVPRLGIADHGKTVKQGNQYQAHLKVS